MNRALDLLQPYPFEKLRALLAGAQPPADKKPIALSIGEPKHRSPEFVARALADSLDQLSVYPTTLGLPALREAIAHWCERRFGVPAGWLDAARHVLPVNGTREALFAFTQAVVSREPDALVVSPNPFYQIYEGATLLAGAQPHYLPCLEGNGFNPVALNANDIPAQLKLTTGMIDAAPSPPYPALLLQIFRDAKYMLDVRFAPLYGAVVMTNEAWNKIEANDRPIVMAAAKNAGKRLLGDAPKLDADSIATMKTRGLTVTSLDPKTTAAFRAEAEGFVKSMRGQMVPADVFDAAVRERDAFRKTQK